MTPNQRRTGQHAQAAAIANQQGTTKTEPSSNGPSSQPSAAAPQSSSQGQGGQDYSAQWAEYYRKLAEYQKANGGASAGQGGNPGY